MDNNQNKDQKKEKTIEYCIARKEHLSGILELYKQLQLEDEPLDLGEAERIWEKGGSQGITYFTAIHEDRVVGTLFMAVLGNLTRQGRSIGFVENMIVCREYRRRGIGKKLIQMAKDHGKKNNCYKILLFSNHTRKEAHAFYESCGFDGNSRRGFIYKPQAD